MLPRTYTIGPLRCVAILALIAFTGVTKVLAHSWAGHIDWHFNEAVNEKTKGAVTDSHGECRGFGRRYDTENAWGTLDTYFPSSHYLQKEVGDTLACSKGIRGPGPEDNGENEQLASPISDAHTAYEFGPITVSRKIAELHLRWQEKTHFVDKEEEHFVCICMI